MVTVPNNATIKGYISDGTASATAGDATITFIGVSVALFAQADIFVQAGYSGVIFGIDTDANTVTLQQAWAGPTSSAAAYDVVLIPQSTELAETTRRMMEALQGSLLSIVNMTPEDGQTLVWQDGQWVAHDPYTDAPALAAIPGKNRLINGDFRIDQRNNFTTQPVGGGSYIADRWQFGNSQSGVFNMSLILNGVAAPSGVLARADVVAAHSSLIGTDNLSHHPNHRRQQYHRF